MHGDTIVILHTTVPGNSAFVVPVDSTRGLIQGTQASIASGSSFLAPGTFRGRWTKGVVTYSISCTGQNVTVDEQILTGVAGTSADWETQGASPSFTQVAAAATTTREFTPSAADFRLLVSAGATGPTTITIRLMVHFTTDRGT